MPAYYLKPPAAGFILDSKAVGLVCWVRPYRVDYYCIIFHCWFFFHCNLKLHAYKNVTAFGDEIPRFPTKVCCSAPLGSFIPDPNTLQWPSQIYSLGATWRSGARVITEIWGEDPSEVQGQSAGAEIMGRCPLKLKSFCHLNVQRRSKFIPFTAVSVLSILPKVDCTV